jgi:hypothetical protein
MPRLLLGSGVTAAVPDGRGADGRDADPPGAGRRVPGRAGWPRLSLLAADGWLAGRGRLLPAIQAAEPSAMSAATTATVSRVRPDTGVPGGGGRFWAVAGGSGRWAKSASQVVVPGLPERSALAGCGLVGPALAGCGLAGSGLPGSAPARAASSAGSRGRRIPAPQWAQYRRVPLTGIPHAVQNLIAVSRT